MICRVQVDEGRAVAKTVSDPFARERGVWKVPRGEKLVDYGLGDGKDEVGEK